MVSDGGVGGRCCLSLAVSVVVAALALVCDGGANAHAARCGHNDTRVLNLAPGWNNTQCAYAGTIPLPHRGKSWLYYTFFTALNGNSSAPVILWMNGGPGASSSMGLFYEFGPYYFKSNTTLARRAVTWNEKYHILFLDQPIGTGLSYHDPEVSLLHNETQVAGDVDFFLRKFFTKYSEYQHNAFFVFGESYGGHYVPSVSKEIYDRNAAGAKPHILLKGLAVGNGFNSPCEQAPHSPDLALQMGLMNRNEYAEAQLLVDNLRVQCAANNTLEAFAALGLVFESVLAASGQVNDENFRMFEHYDYTLMNQFFNQGAVQEALHVGPPFVPYVTQNYEVFAALTFDQMTSMKPRYAYLLEHGLDVLIYHGTDDPCFATSGEEAWLRSLEWSGQKAFREAKRKLWRTRGAAQRKAGYVTIHENLKFAVVPNAGHLSPADQPENVFDLCQRFIERDWEM